MTTDRTTPGDALRAFADQLDIYGAQVFSAHTIANMARARAAEMHPECDHAPDPRPVADRAASAVIARLADSALGNGFAAWFAGFTGTEQDAVHGMVADAIRVQLEQPTESFGGPDLSRAVALELAVQWATYSGHTVGEPDSGLVVQAAHAFAAFLRGDQPDPQAAYRRPEDQR